MLQVGIYNITSVHAGLCLNLQGSLQMGSGTHYAQKETQDLYLSFKFVLMQEQNSLAQALTK